MSYYLYAICKRLAFNHYLIGLNAASFSNAFSIAFICLTICDESRLLPQYRRLARICLISLCVVYFGFYLVRLEQYSQTLCLIDHFEPSAITISWLWGRGGDMYHNTVAAERYAFLYGPIMYMSDWLFLDAFGPSIHAAKLSGVLLSLASVALIFWTVKRVTSPYLASISTTYCLLVFLLRGDSVTSFNLRAEPHLIFWVSVGLFSGSLSIPVLAALGCGLVTGILVNIKIHAGLYALPILALLYQRHGGRTVFVAVLLAVLVAACPFFVFKGISLTNYLTWFLTLATRQGLSRDCFKAVVIEELFDILPVVASLGCLILVDRRRCLTFLRTNRALFLALNLGLLLLLVPASKEGAGPHHIMPFIPTLALVIGITLDQPVAYGELLGWGSRSVRSAGIAFPLMALAYTLPNQLTSMENERACDARAGTILSEIDAIEKLFPGGRLAVGYGGDGSYTDTNLKATLVLKGNPYLIDSAALMEMNLSRLKIPETTHAAIRKGMIDVWLIPAGDDPFSLHTFYSSKAPIFEPSFRKGFLDHYSICHRTKHLDVWCYTGKRN